MITITWQGSSHSVSHPSIPILKVINLVQNINVVNVMFVVFISLYGCWVISPFFLLMFLWLVCYTHEQGVCYIAVFIE